MGKPSMVTPGAQSGAKAEPAVIAASTLAALKRVVPPALPGIMFLSGGQSELEATLNLNAMNQSPNPIDMSILSFTCLLAFSKAARHDKKSDAARPYSRVVVSSEFWRCGWRR